MVSGDAFSIATLLYARLRRVTGRVIDVMYLVQNTEYAVEVIALAEAAQDVELDRLVGQLKVVMQLESEPEAEVDDIAKVADELEAVEPTEDDVFRAQVSHHYIGALR